jgi:intracellular sulfur oxidation DsrE/DsrF family protein
MVLTQKPGRRGFLGVLAAAAAATLPLEEIRASGGGGQSDPDGWLAEVRGDHRCLFDFPAHKNGFPLLHILNYIATYKSAYGTGPGQVGAVGTFYGLGGGSSIPMGFDDEIWAKYQLGEYTGLRDASGRPYTRNVFHKPTEADGHLFSQAVQSPELPIFGGAIVAAGIANLQGMGTKFIMCGNALQAWTFELAARGKGTQPDIDKFLRAHLLPGVTVVPAMVIAIERAQSAGISYNKQ